MKTTPQPHNENQIPYLSSRTWQRTRRSRRSRRTLGQQEAGVQGSCVDPNLMAVTGRDTWAGGRACRRTKGALRPATVVSGANPYTGAAAQPPPPPVSGPACSALHAPAPSWSTESAPPGRARPARTQPRTPPAPPPARPTPRTSALG